MAVFLKPPDTSLPTELLHESGLLYGEYPALEALGFLTAIHRHVWEW